MSFTLMRYKGGRPTPVKLSIWDAFKGVPNPRPRPPKPCSCCNKVHPKKHRQAKIQETASSRTSQTGKETHEQSSKPNRSTHDNETYTSEDDAKIIEMKASQSSWKQILAAIQKESLSQLKEHWKTIDPNRASNDTTKTHDENSGATGPAKTKQGMDESKRADIERKKAEGQARKQKQKEEQNAAAAGPAVTLDSLHSGASELKSFADRYDRHKWMAAASRHFDRTGERITAATAQRMAEGR